MDPAPEVIRHQIEQTRCSLTEKLETLEHQVRDTVTSARDTVEGTIQNVKSTVDETVASVKRTLDPKYQVEQHPWAMFGGSVLAGYLLGRFWSGRSSTPASWVPPATPRRDGTMRSETGASLASAEALTPPSQPAPESRPGMISRFVHQFDNEIEQVKELAIGAAVGVLQDLVRDALPQYRPQIDQVMESATRKLGGRPIPHHSSAASAAAGRSI